MKPRIVHPVLLACLAWILYGRPGVLPPYVAGLLAGIASGAAMITYTVIKEANPPRLSGTSTGVVNFINFTFSALLGPIFAGLLIRAAGGEGGTPQLSHYQAAFSPMLVGVGLAIVLTLLLKETGPAVKGMVAPREIPATEGARPRQTLAPSQPRTAKNANAPGTSSHE